MTFSPDPSLIKQNRQKTRFGANPKFRNTGEIIYGTSSCPSYITEKERFNVKGNYLADLVNKEKDQKKFVREGRLERMRNQKTNSNTINYCKEYPTKYKSKYSLLQKSKKAYKHENLIKNNNMIIE